ncbi:MAG: transporter substrate-binding domain-containing protein [Candidatus Celaenobacter polaris]|nr:transporter substrate-binding domain-containing protein [Candidatus Celaenobacter polaris]
MKMKSFLLILLIALLLSTTALSAKERGIVFAFDKTHAPFSFIENDEPAGFDIDLLTPMFEGTIYGFTPTEFKWSDALVSLRKGVKVDLMSQMDKTPEREEIYDFSDEPYLIDEIRIFSKDDSISSIDDLAGKKVAVQKGSYYEEMLRQNDQITILPTESEYDALDALDNSIVDAFVGPTSVARFIIKKNGYENIISAEELLETSYMYLAVDKNDGELLEFINKGLQTIKENGTYDKVQEKWFGKGEYEKEPECETPCEHPSDK